MTTQLTRAKTIAKEAEKHLRAKAERTTEYVIGEHTDYLNRMARLVDNFKPGEKMKNWGEA